MEIFTTDNQRIKATIRNFDMTIGKIDMDDIDQDRLKYLKKISESYKKYYNNESIRLSKIEKYSAMIHNIRIKMRPLGVTKSSEILLILMFAIDPNLEALITFNEYCRMDDIKREITKKIGFFSLTLINTEKEYMKKLLKAEDRIKIEEEIDRRSYK